MKGSVTVLGAGIVGLCCALALQRSDWAVTLLDRAEPGEGCSSGNAGMIQTGSVLPLAQPGIVGRVPRMLMDPEGPLALRWGQVPRLLPWLAALVRNSRPEKVAEISRHLASLLSDAKQAYATLAGDPETGALFRPRGELYVFADEVSYGAAQAKMPAYREHGIAYMPLEGEALREMEPALSPAYRHGYYLPDSAYVTDPLLLSRRIFALFTEAGGAFHRDDVTRIDRLEGGRSKLTARAATYLCDRLVVAAGAAAGRLTATAGFRLPVEPLRGYHLMLPAAGLGLQGPVIEGAMNIAATPMQGGIRLAGTLEFAGFSDQPRWHRADMLAGMAKRMLPDLSTEITARWFGDRPGTPDGLPIIGELAPGTNIWCAMGHGMLGLTLAATTGLMVSRMVAGERVNIAAAPFAPDRFLKSSADRKAVAHG